MQMGWIKLHRELMEKAIWMQSTPEQKVVLITVLMLANHKSNEWEFAGEKFRCMPGQFVTSLNSLTDACGKGVSIQNVRTALNRFEKLGFLTNQSTKTGRLITVVNWGIYQDSIEESNKGINKESTKRSQSSNKDLTPNNNNKNVKKERNVFTPPSVDEVASYCRERSNGIDAEVFVSFYKSKGWMVGSNKMKDWKAAVRTWERNRTQKGGNVNAGRAEQRAIYDQEYL